MYSRHRDARYVIYHFIYHLPHVHLFIGFFILLQRSSLLLC